MGINRYEVLKQTRRVEMLPKEAKAFVEGYIMGRCQQVSSKESKEKK